ncbi:MAG: SapC family protein [Pseudomonadota bacterium]
MTSPTLLDSALHADLRLRPNSGVRFASQHHVLPIRAEEIAKAVSNFPVFLTRNTDSGDWSFSIVTSLQIERNLFCDSQQWHATYLPQVIETFPFYLVNTGSDDQRAVGFDSSADAFSNSEGDALFHADGKLAPWLDALTRKLDAQLQANHQTKHFANTIENAGLIKELSIQVLFHNDTAQTINGLHTIDEEKLQALDAETLTEFSQRGYLSPLYAMLISVFQLNALIQRHNRLVNDDAAMDTIERIKLELARDAGAAGHVS